MTQFFAKKLNKKGFTLAELLIVLAIIAVLIAIALPIFTGALEKARYGVHYSNARSLKSMAVTEILTNPKLLGEKTINENSYWAVSGSYNYSTEQFDITAIKYREDANVNSDMFAKAHGTSSAWVKLDGSQASVKAVGKIPTAGTNPIDYIIYIRGNEINSEIDVT